MHPESPKSIECTPATREDIVAILRDEKLSNESAEAIVCEWIELKKQEYDQNKGLFDGISLELDVVEVFFEAGMFDRVAEYLDNVEQLIQCEVYHFNQMPDEIPPELQVQVERFEALAQRFIKINQIPRATLLKSTAEELETFRARFTTKREQLFLYKLPRENIQSEGLSYINTIANILTERLDDPKMITLVNVISNATNIPEIARIRNSVTEGAIPRSISEINRHITTQTIQALREGRITVEQWLDILDDYEEIIRKCTEWIKDKEPVLKENFLRSFMSKINPTLSQPKTREEIQNIIDEVDFHVFDPMGYEASAASLSIEQKIAFTDISYIAPAIIEEELGETESTGSYAKIEQTIDHELLHHISTRSRILTFINAEKTKSYINHEWTGVALNTGAQTKLVWLNESVTELLAATMASSNPSAYLAEINLFKVFCAKGNPPLDMQLFVDAYFENKDRDNDPEGTALVFWKRLIDAIRISYPHDPQFLFKLDRFVTEHGVRHALELMSSWDGSAEKDPFKG